MSERPCIVCAATSQIKEGVVLEIVLVGVVLHGMGAGLLPGGRPSLCPEHNVVRAIMMASLASQSELGALSS